MNLDFVWRLDPQTQRLEMRWRSVGLANRPATDDRHGGPGSRVVPLRSRQYTSQNMSHRRAST